jgi:hypothetical protein
MMYKPTLAQLISCALLIALPSIVTAQTSSEAANRAPEAFTDVLACRAINVESERLACFDRSIALLEDARQRQQVVVINTDDVREVRRSLFGLKVPTLRLLEGQGREDQQPESFTGTIRKVQQVRGGRWLVQIDEAVWQTTETGYFQVPPQVGQQATVTQGLLGSFRLSVAGRAGLKATRLR